jgi:hypothetical protein
METLKFTFLREERWLSEHRTSYRYDCGHERQNREDYSEPCVHRACSVNHTVESVHRENRREGYRNDGHHK